MALYIVAMMISLELPETSGLMSLPSSYDSLLSLAGIVLRIICTNSPNSHNSPKKESIFQIRRLRHTKFILFAEGHAICLWSWNQMLSILAPQPALITIAVGFFSPHLVWREENFCQSCRILSTFGVKRILQLWQKCKMFLHCCFNLHIPDFWDICEGGHLSVCLLSTQASFCMHCLFNIFAHFPFGFPVSFWFWIVCQLCITT